MAAEFSDILAALQKRLQEFTKTIPGAQRSMYDAITEEINRLELFTDGTVKASVKNMGILNSIRNKINRVVLTDDYKNSVKNFAGAFNEITRLQNDYWRSVESNFSPTPLLREIRKSAITDTVNRLTEAGIGANVSDKLVEILRTNITSGGSYKQLAAQLRDGLLNTEQKGYLDRYARQVATDSINQYNAQYTQAVSSDLGYTWYKYDNTDIETTRPFCDHMTDQPYFHISQVPALLKGQTTTGQVPLYKKTDLPEGMIPGTNPENFFIRRGGYNCGHQIRPVNERQVPAEIRAQVYATSAYQLWSKKAGAPPLPPPEKAPAADTIKRATDWAKENIAVEVKYNVTDKHLPAINEMHTEISSLLGEFSGFSYGKRNTLNSIEVRAFNTGAELGLSGFADNAGNITINQAAITQKGIENIIKGAQAGITIKVRPGTEVKALIRHEFGHTLWQNTKNIDQLTPQAREFGVEIKKLYKDYLKDVDANIGSYSRYDVNEFFAEHFAADKYGQKTKYTKAVNELVKKYFK